MMKKLLSGKLLRLISITAALVLAVSATGCGSEQSSDSTSSSNVYSVAGLGGENEPEYPVFHIGDTLNVDSSFEITCTKVEDDDSSGLFVDYLEGMKIIRAYFTAKNITKSNQLIDWIDFKCFADGEDCVHACTSRDMAEDDKIRRENKDLFFLGTDLKPGKTVEGYVYFYVPENYNHLELRFLSWDAVIEVQ